MHLKMYREHFTNKGNRTWKPKRGFISEEQIQEQLGFDPAKCNIYKCTVCNMLHMGREPKKNDSNRR